ncbi:MAG: ribosomal-processing cysteine protease Prp [Thermotogota bacterium]
MVKVSFYQNEVILKGHAMHGEYGQDIVCSAISSISQFTAEFLKREKIGQYNKKNGYLRIKYSETDLALKIIEHLKEAIISIEKDYPGNVKVEVKNK